MLEITPERALKYLTQRISYNASGNEEYIGYAEPGKGETEGAWQIRKLIYDDSNRIISILYAKGTCNFKYKWSERTIYNYE